MKFVCSKLWSGGENAKPVIEEYEGGEMWMITAESAPTKTKGVKR